LKKENFDIFSAKLFAIKKLKSFSFTPIFYRVTVIFKLNIFFLKIFTHDKSTHTKHIPRVISFFNIL